MAGTFGYELDPKRLSKKELDTIRGQVQDFRKLSHLVREGRYWRLGDPQRDAVVGWEYVSADGDEALVCAVVLRVEANEGMRYLVPCGLTPGATYVERASGRYYPADALMDMGMPLPGARSLYDSVQVHLLRCDGVADIKEGTRR